MASSRKRPIHETMHSVDGDRCSEACRLVKLRGLSLPARTSVGNSCLAAICTRLTRLESVGHLGSRTALTADLRALKQLRRIGPGSFAHCVTLRSVSLSGLSEMISVGEDFLLGCTSLTSVDLSGMTQLTCIGDYFLSSCTSLTSVDFSGMSQLTCMGHSFLMGCTSLNTVDLRGLSQLTMVGSHMMHACHPSLVKAVGISELLLRMTQEVKLELAVVIL